jgi:hypothetical protein
VWRSPSLRSVHCPTTLLRHAPFSTPTLKAQRFVSLSKCVAFGTPDNKTAPCSLGRTARTLRISLLTLASGSSMTIYKTLSSGSVAMPLLSGETTAGSSPAAQRIVPDQLANRQGRKTIFVVLFLAAASPRPSSAAGRIAPCAGNVKKLLCQVYQRSFGSTVLRYIKPLYTLVESRFDR